MDLANLSNPFVNAKLDNTARVPPGDVPELHSAVINECVLALQATRVSRQSTSLLVVGEAGSGKSHMIAQFRHQTASDPTAVLAAIRLGGANAGNLWRHLRNQFVTEILAKDPGTKNGENGLSRILRNRFPKWASGSGVGSSVLDWVLGKVDASEQLSRQLEEFVKVCPSFAYKLRVVLPKCTRRELTTLAQDWLRGEQLSDTDLKRLGLPPEFPTDMEQETISRDVVLSLLQLAGDKTALFLFFDEVEAIQAGNHDEAVLRQFATMATQLLTDSGMKVVAISIRPDLQIKLKKAVEKSNFQKISQYQAFISSLTWEQTVRVVRCRLDAEPSCQAARQAYAHDPDWPIGREFVNRTFTENRRSLTPRHLILACRVEFDRLKKGKPPVNKQLGTPAPTENGPVTASHEAPTDELNRMWERQRKKYLAKPQSVQFDNVLALGLPWLVELCDVPLVRIHNVDGQLGDVNLVFKPKAERRKPIGISFCNHVPSLLWHRLDRLIRQWDVAKNAILSGLVILRAEVTETRPGSATRLEKLTKAGVRLIRIDPQQLAELTAFQAMLTAALEGEMTRSGAPVEPAGYDAWASDHLSESVKEFMNHVFGSEIIRAAARPPMGMSKAQVPTAQALSK